MYVLGLRGEKALMAVGLEQLRLLLGHLTPMSCIATWEALSKQMSCTIPPAPRAKRNGVGRKHWGAAPGVVARNVSPAGAIMTKTGQRLLRGSVGRGQSSSRRPAIAP